MHNKKAFRKDVLKQNLKLKDEENLINSLSQEPITIDIDKEEKKTITKADKIADWITALVGSWKFIIGFSSFLIGWILLNIYFYPIDPYPFILLNLLLSCIAAIQAPIIMISQNRCAKKDSIRNQNDLRIDLKSELLLEEIYDKVLHLEEELQEYKSKNHKI